MDEIQARLRIIGLPSMSLKEKNILISWLRDVANVIKKEKDLKVFNKNYRATLYKA